MTSTERSRPASPNSPTPSLALKSENQLTPRVISFLEDSLLRVPLDLSIDLSSYSDSSKPSSATGPSFLLSGLRDPSLRSNSLSEDPLRHPPCPEPEHSRSIDSDCISECPVMSSSESTKSDDFTIPSMVKFKRSSSSSNDVTHERDRFRARFKSFNTSKTPGEQGRNLTFRKIGADICECDDILTKTKKLNIKPVLSRDSLKNLAYVDSSEKSPLDRDSPRFLLYPLYGQDRDILQLRLITPTQLEFLFQWYFNQPLPPTQEMFPWLHGLHQENFAQRSFFASQQVLELFGNLGGNLEPKSCKPSKARFLMCVETTKDKTSLSKVIKNTVKVDEILQRIEFSKSEVISHVSDAIASLFQGSKQVINATTNEIIHDCLETGYLPLFLDSDPRRGVSLRNFHIQVNKSATCADMVVYCSESKHGSLSCQCPSFSRLLRMAQARENAGNPDKYNTFILDLEKSVQELSPKILTVRDCSSIFAGQESRKKTHLQLYNMILINSDTFSYWDADYQVKEKIETTVMSSATKLHLNVWLGNIWDHQSMMHCLNFLPSLDTSHTFKVTGLKDYKNLYCDPKMSTLTKDITTKSQSALVSILPPPRAHWQLFFHCHNNASFPSESQLRELIFKFSISSRKASEISEVHQLEFPSSGSIGFGDCSEESLMSVVNTCKTIYLYSSSVAEGSLACLIYCSDGYTELSLLILCYIIYAEDLLLEEAMLKLHLEYGRPFYIFNTDVQVFRKLGRLLRKFSPKAKGAQIDWSRPETLSRQEFTEIILGPLKCVASCSTIPRRLRLGYIANDSDTDSSDSETETCAAQSLDSNWVEEVEGSLPSRILPYMYLGSLKHANNLTVLAKLGITRLICVGESLDWLNGYKFLAQHDVTTTDIDHGKIVIYNIKPKTASGCSVESVMKVNNLQDDGIDDLSQSLPQILRHVEEVHQETKGEARFLVHCRVGVSRSATVVIAEVMRRLGLNLPKAYLYVRVRRLNIVIQPNLRFMYELLKWEEMERAQGKMQGLEAGDLRVIDWFVMCQEIRKLNLLFI